MNDEELLKVLEELDVDDKADDEPGFLRDLMQQAPGDLHIRIMNSLRQEMEEEQKRESKVIEIKPRNRVNYRKYASFTAAAALLAVVFIGGGTQLLHKKITPLTNTYYNKTTINDTNLSVGIKKQQTVQKVLKPSARTAGKTTETYGNQTKETKAASSQTSTIKSNVMARKSVDQGTAANQEVNRTGVKAQAKAKVNSMFAARMQLVPNQPANNNGDSSSDNDPNRSLIANMTAPQDTNKTTNNESSGNNEPQKNLQETAPSASNAASDNSKASDKGIPSATATDPEKALIASTNTSKTEKPNDANSTELTAAEAQKKADAAAVASASNTKDGNLNTAKDQSPKNQKTAAAKPSGPSEALKKPQDTAKTADKSTKTAKNEAPKANASSSSKTQTAADAKKADAAKTPPVGLKIAAVDRTGNAEQSTGTKTGSSDNNKKQNDGNNKETANASNPGNSTTTGNSTANNPANDTPSGSIASLNDITVNYIVLLEATQTELMQFIKEKSSVLSEADKTYKMPRSNFNKLNEMLDRNQLQQISDLPDDRPYVVIQIDIQ